MKRTVLITGASGGIGSAIAEEFAKLGYNIVLHYFKNEEKALTLLNSLNKSGANVIAVKADITDAGQVDEMFKKTVAAFGNIDVLVNNAGISHIAPINDVSEKEWDNIFAVNTKSAYLCSKQAISLMLKHHYGRIINISSMWGIVGSSCEVPYSASKAAIIGFTKALAKELGPSGITVNCVSPGLIETKMNNNVSKEDLDVFISEIPVLRIGKPYEVAATVLFLAGENSGYITGQNIAVDGGIS